jgi:hypothetical protein
LRAAYVTSGQRAVAGRGDALDDLRHAALDRPRPELVKVDRSRLNQNHPIVKALYAAVDRILGPIVADEERRADAHLVRAGGALRARDQVVRELNRGSARVREARRSA